MPFSTSSCRHSYHEINSHISEEDRSVGSSVAVYANHNGHPTIRGRDSGNYESVSYAEARPNQLSVNVQPKTARKISNTTSMHSFGGGGMNRGK